MIRNERDVAFRARKRRVANEWKSSEFQNHVYFATKAGLTQPMVDYLLSTKPLLRKDRQILATYLVSLRTELELLKPRRAGRKVRTPSNAAELEIAERNAAWLVAFSKKSWREQHGRRRVPEKETKTMIRNAIEAAAKAFNKPAELIKPDNIRSALKSGRIVVRY
jgi:hypothetical protein